MSAPTLVLRHTMEPHRVASWQEAICLVVTHKVDVIEEYEETVSSPSVTMAIPAVVKLRRPVPRRKKSVKFSRVNVATRDEFRCQYCGARRELPELNYDHVVPRVRGGKTVWENIVSSCYACNDRKGQMTPEEAEKAGLRLRKKPVRPQSLPMRGFIRGEIPEEWSPYLDGYDVGRKAG